MKLISFIGIFIFLFSTGVQAARVDSVVEVLALPPASAVPAGGSAALTIELDIARSYHINSHRPLQDYLIPTSVEFDPLPGVTFDEAVFPEAEVKKLPVSDTPMAVYERKVKITAQMRPAGDFVRNEVMVRGRIRVQACDRNSCLPPVWIPFSVTVPIATALSPVAGARPESDPISSADDVRDDDGALSAGGFDRQGLALNLLLAFLGGLALNLTPCVYPLIPVTLAWFGAESQGRKGNLLVHATIYVLGMAATYSTLGVVAALTGSLFGAALQSALVLKALALIMILLALSMFDVYELRLPIALNRLAALTRTGPAGTFMMGLTMGIVAAPCIGPFVLGLLTYVGERASVVMGFLLFFALSLGLGAPFLVLGLFSGSLHRLPRSGAWMVWVRKIFGFVLLGMALYFLRPLLPALTWPLGLAFLLLLGGIYLAWIVPVPDAGRSFIFFRNLTGALCFVAALYVAIAGVDVAWRQYALVNTGGEVKKSIHWEKYSKERLAQAALRRQPVFIDFYADWCAPCRELDEKTYSDPEVIRLSRQFVMLKADLTADDDPATRALMETYRIRGVPTLVFLRADGGEMPTLRGTGFETAGKFLEKMNRVLRAAPDRLPRERE